jgi:hypothetical protein
MLSGLLNKHGRFNLRCTVQKDKLLGIYQWGCYRKIVYYGCAPPKHVSTELQQEVAAGKQLEKRLEDHIMTVIRSF